MCVRVEVIEMLAVVVQYVGDLLSVAHVFVVFLFFVMMSKLSLTLASQVNLLRSSS